jgi:hypothetical protein
VNKLTAEQIAEQICEDLDERIAEIEQQQMAESIFNWLKTRIQSALDARGKHDG